MSEDKKKLKFLCYSPMFGQSHTTWMGTLCDLLIAEGHEVVMFSPLFYTETASHGTEKARIITYPQCKIAREREEATKKAGGTISNFWASKPMTLNSWNAFKPMKMAFVEQCSEILSDKAVLDELRAENFDAGFTETVDLLGVALFNLLGITRYALTISLPSYDWGFSVTGMPAAPSYVPCLMTPYGEKMSFSQRRENLQALEISREFIDDVYRMYDAAIRKLFPAFPRVEKLLSDSSFIFLNTDPLFDFPRPTVHKIIEIGGITVDVKPRELEKKWNDLLSLRKKTVFLCFGSVVKSYLMPEEYKKTIVEVLRRFPEITFIWKYEQPEDKISDGVENIVEVQWAPQVDLLHDSRLSLFITHAGMGSVNEALLGGVPMLVIPVVGDQHRNAQLIKRMGSGTVFDKFDLVSAQKFENALSEALLNPVYKEAASRNVSMLRNRPFSMKEIFTRNMQFMGEYGSLEGLNHYGRHLSFAQYYGLDVIAATVLQKVATVTGVIVAGVFAWKAVRHWRA